MDARHLTSKHTKQLILMENGWFEVTALPLVLLGVGHSLLSSTYGSDDDLMFAWIITTDGKQAVPMPI